MDNGSISPALNNCIEMHALVMDPIYFIPSFLGSSSGILAVAMALYALIAFIRNSYFHMNVKILLGLLLIACLMYSAISAILILHTVANAFLSEDPCYLNSFCFPFRRVLMTCFLCLVTIQMAIIIDRVVATKYRTLYGTAKCHLGILLLIISVTISSILVAWALRNEDPNEYTLSCITIPRPIQADVVRVYQIIFFLDVVSLISFIVLYQYNIRKSSISCQLSNKFQRCENVNVLRSLVPLIITNGILDVLTIIFVILAKIFRSKLSCKNHRFVENIAYMVHPQYCLVMVILLLFVLKKNRQRRRTQISTIVKKTTPKEQEDMYFRSYAKQW